VSASDEEITDGGEPQIRVSAEEAGRETVRPDKPALTLEELGPYYLGTYFATVAMQKKLEGEGGGRRLPGSGQRVQRGDPGDHRAGLFLNSEDARARYGLAPRTDTARWPTCYRSAHGGSQYALEIRPPRSGWARAETGTTRETAASIGKVGLT
jgi:hypothetical protein